MERRYTLRFDFDAQGEAPRIMIHDNQERATVMEIFDTPLFRGAGDWSSNDEDWTLSIDASQIVDRLNS